MSILTPTYRRAAELITGAQHPLLVNPTHPDPDSLGSSLAVARHLKNIGRMPTVLCPSDEMRHLSFLSGFRHLHRDAHSLNLDAYDRIIFFDTADPSLSNIAHVLSASASASRMIINIDHHATNKGFGDLSLVEPHRTATCELIYHLFLEAGWPIDREAATCLLTGIVSDTGIFSFRNTTDHAFSVAARLLEHGARLSLIMDSAFRSKSLGALQLWGRALERLTLDDATGIVTTYVTLDDERACGVDAHAADGIANLLNLVGEGKATLVLRELSGGGVKGSLRTMHDDVDVATLAQRFGGGGHRRAAGFSTRQTIQQVLTSLREMDKPPGTR